MGVVIEAMTRVQFEPAVYISQEEEFLILLVMSVIAVCIIYNICQYLSRERDRVIDESRRTDEEIRRRVERGRRMYEEFRRIIEDSRLDEQSRRIIEETRREIEESLRRDEELQHQIRSQTQEFRRRNEETRRYFEELRLRRMNEETPRTGEEESEPRHVYVLYPTQPDDNPVLLFPSPSTTSTPVESWENLSKHDELVWKREKWKKFLGTKSSFDSTVLTFAKRCNDPCLLAIVTGGECYEPPRKPGVPMNEETPRTGEEESEPRHVYVLYPTQPDDNPVLLFPSPSTTSTPVESWENLSKHDELVWKREKWKKFLGTKSSFDSTVLTFAKRCNDPCLLAIVTGVECYE